MLLSPGAPGHDRGREHRQPRALQRADNGLAEQLAPQALGLTVKHDQDVAIQLAGDAEAQYLPVDLAGIHDARETERSPGRRDGPAAHDIVDDLVAVELQDRVGVPDALVAEGQHRLAVVHDAAVDRFLDGHELGIVNGRNAVRWQQGDDFLRVNRLDGEGEPASACCRRDLLPVPPCHRRRRAGRRSAPSGRPEAPTGSTCRPAAADSSWSWRSTARIFYAPGSETAVVSPTHGADGQCAREQW